LAARLKEGLQTSLAVRGILQVEQRDESEFVVHALANYAWLIGDVCVHTGYGEGSDLHEYAGLRIAYALEEEAGNRYLTSGRRTEIDHLLNAIVARGVHEPKKQLTQRIRVPGPVEILVVRTAEDMWSAEPKIPAYVVLFDVGRTPLDFEERLIEVVSHQLVQKAYMSEVLVWSWIGPAANRPNTYYAAITTNGHQRVGRTAALFKGLSPTYYETGEDQLKGDARPLLRWRPSEGLTRFWTTAPPPDTHWSKGKHSAPLRHRVPYVVRAADEALDLKVDALELQHVRNHETFIHRFAPHFNVIIGDNAKGKTTLLDALAVRIPA
jgi:hypothetical protein